MEALWDLILKTYGIVGLVMLSPFVGIVVLWRAYSKKDKDTDRLLLELQEKRINDNKEISAKLIVIVTEQSALNKETNIALDRIGDLIATLPPRKRG